MVHSACICFAHTRIERRRGRIIVDVNSIMELKGILTAKQSYQVQTRSCAKQSAAAKLFPSAKPTVGEDAHKTQSEDSAPPRLPDGKELHVRARSKPLAIADIHPSC